MSEYFLLVVRGETLVCVTWGKLLMRLTLARLCKKVFLANLIKSTTYAILSFSILQDYMWLKNVCATNDSTRFVTQHFTRIRRPNH